MLEYDVEPLFGLKGTCDRVSNIYFGQRECRKSAG